MSENLQHRQGSSSSTRPHHQRRVDRQASSCTECRRRKQKCSQGQPCTNCARRFPQPICDYETKPRGTRSGPREADGVAARTVSKEGPYPHLNLAGIQDALLQLESESGDPSLKEEDELAPLFDGSAAFIPDPSQPPSTPIVTGHLWNWLPFKLAGQGISRRRGRQLVAGTIKKILDRRNDVDGPLDPRHEWILDAARLVRSVQAPQPSLSLQKMDQELRQLPMAPTKLNKKLVRTHLRLLSRFKASVGGDPNPDNPFMKHWVPYIIQDPLLIKTVLFTSACFLNETGHLPRSVITAFRGLVIQSLNEFLQSPEMQTSDSAILAVAEMVLDEWYWGRTQDLYAHMRGLKTMIRMRGGLQDLGMHGYISKMIIIHDISMALAHEVQPEMFGRPGFEFSDPVMVPFQLSLNSPLTTGWPSFASCAASLRIHPCAAMILDDVRAMVEAVLSLPHFPTSDQLQHASSVISQIYTRIDRLPENVSTCQSPPGNIPVAELSSDTDSPPNAGDGSANPSVGRQKTASGLAGGTGPFHGSTSGSGGQESSPDKTDSINRGSPPAEAPDLVYRMVRMTAMVYCRAVLYRKPTSAVCTQKELLQIWGLSWSIPMTARTSILGIYIWTMLTLAPSCHNAAPARFIKSLLVNGFLTAAVENWHVTMDAAHAALRLQTWLRESDTPRGFISGGEGAIEKHGFAVKEVLPDISTVHKPVDGEDDDDD